MRASRWLSTGGMWLFGLRAPYGVSPTTKPESVIALGSQLQSLHPLAVVLESARGPTRQVRDFAQATGRLAKPDALDGQILANFAETGRPHGASPARLRHPGTPLSDHPAQPGGVHVGG